MNISSIRDIEQERGKGAQSASHVIKAIAEIIKAETPLDALYSMKFFEIGAHPLDQYQLNLIEQLNQTFTILASLAGAQILLAADPSLTLKLNPGAQAGSDIVSTDMTIVAEVFAAVDPNNNRKLESDIDRLEKTDAKKRHLFYHTPSNRDVSRITVLHPAIIFRKLTKEEIMIPTIASSVRNSRVTPAVGAPGAPREAVR